MGKEDNIRILNYFYKKEIKIGIPNLYFISLGNTHHAMCFKWLQQTEAQKGWQGHKFCKFS